MVRLQPTLAFQIGETLAIPISGQWRPRFPDRLARPGNVNEFVGFDPLSAAALFPAVPGCVEVFDETVRTAAVTETVAQASITDETVTGGLVSPEETC
jgi:hypothetical protein